MDNISKVEKQDKVDNIIVSNLEEKKIRLDKYLSFCFEFRRIILKRILLNNNYNNYEKGTNSKGLLIELEELIEKIVNIREDEEIKETDFKEIKEYEIYLEYKKLISRSKVQKLIEEGQILVNEKQVSSSYKITNGDIITVNLIEGKVAKVTEKKDKEKFKEIIVYEDDNIVVINKPKGLIVHSGVNTSITLEKILCEYYEEQNIILPGEYGRKGIVHRLDKDTTGLMVIAKNEESYNNLVMQFKTRKTKKKYRAIVKGVVESDGTIKIPITRDKKARHKMKTDPNGKEAITNFKVIKRSSKYTYLDIEILTGRTHQIRVHMAKIGYPIIGDGIYSNGKNQFNIEGQVLQSYSLTILDPNDNQKELHFEIEENNEIKRILNEF